jgi:hypothetical protein
MRALSAKRARGAVGSGVGENEVTLVPETHFRAQKDLLRVDKEPTFINKY